ncbi:MAG: CARDB domain-containing protein [Vulcanimicrobiota bacterium]
MVKFAIASFCLLSLLSGSALAEEEQPKPTPQPDLVIGRIVAPEGVTLGPANKVVATIENPAEGRVEQKIKVELVVIQSTGERTSQSVEIDGLDKNEKRPAEFAGVEVTNSDSVRLLVIVDPDKVIAESNEENNRKIYTAWVKKELPPAGDETPGEAEAQPSP